MAITETLEKSIAALDMRAPAGALDALAEYLALVTKWNRTYNLTSIREPDEMIAGHVLDSAVALPFLRGRRCLDAGSGAGFPGVVLALLAPETEWVLVEARGKKARFLRHAARHLGLDDRVEVVDMRLEDYQSEAGFDTVTARALADLATLAGWTAHLLAPAGRLVALKGRRDRIDAERAELTVDWRLEVVPVRVPGLDAERHVVCLERKG